MPTALFLNGTFFDDPAAARISALDAGFQHAVGLFETILAGTSGDSQPWALHLDRHLDRLAASASQLGLSDSLRTTALAQAVLETVRRSGLQRARVRLTISGGDLSLLARPAAPGKSPARHDPTLLIVAQPATTYPPEMFDRGVTAVIADARANPLNPFEGHKTLNYWWRLRELQVAAAKNAAEAIVLQVTNHVCGGCVSNLFIVKDGELLTPIARSEEAGVKPPDTTGYDPDSPAQTAPAANGHRAPGLPSPVLPGIVRAWIVEQAERRSIPVRREMLSIAEVLDADEVFLTNSSWGALPVTAVEAHPIAQRSVGELSRLFRDAWLESTSA